MRQSKHSLKRVCKNNDVNLWDNDAKDCDDDDSSKEKEEGGEEEEDGEGDDSDADQREEEEEEREGGSAASFSTVIADAFKPTVTPSTSSSIEAQMTLLTQTTSSSSA